MINYQTVIDGALRNQRPAARLVPEQSAEGEALDCSAWTLLASQETWLGLLMEALMQSEADGARLTAHDSGPHAAALRELQRVVALQPDPPDHKRWARRIIARIAAGDRGVRPYQARAALEALSPPDLSEERWSDQ